MKSYTSMSCVNSNHTIYNNCNNKINENQFSQGKKTLVAAAFDTANIVSLHNPVTALLVFIEYYIYTNRVCCTSIRIFFHCPKVRTYFFSCKIDRN